MEAMRKRELIAIIIGVTLDLCAFIPSTFFGFLSFIADIQDYGANFQETINPLGWIIFEGQGNPWFANSGTTMGWKVLTGGFGAPVQYIIPGILLIAGCALVLFGIKNRKIAILGSIILISSPIIFALMTIFDYNGSVGLFINSPFSSMIPYSMNPLFGSCTGCDPWSQGYGGTWFLSGGFFCPIIGGVIILAFYGQLKKQQQIEIKHQYLQKV